MMSVATVATAILMRRRISRLCDQFRARVEGILFVDHLSALRRNMIMRRLAKEQRQKRDDAKRR